MKLVYVLNTYPQRSHSFIRREVQALERRGATILRIAMRGAGIAMVDPLDVAEDARSEHILDQGALGLAAAVARRIIKTPGAAVATVCLALAIGRRSDKGMVRHMVYFAEACHLAKRVETENAEHMHAHFGTNAATVAMLASALTGVPYSFTVHGPEEFDSPKGLGLPEKMRRAAFVVAISQFGRSQLCRWVGPKHWSKIHVVHCGIEPDAFAEPVPVPEGAPRFVCIGRFAEQKGHLVLVRAFAEALKDVPDMHLTLVGDGEMRGEIEAAVGSLGLGRAVSMTGWVGEERIRLELAEAHALVAPSFAEGLPMVIMEAMASARPVISTYVAGIPELVQQGKTGWLVPAGDVTALAGAMRDVARIPIARLSDLGVEGRRRVLGRHDIDQEAARLAGLFAASIKEAGMG
ncbi:MAG: glycosyltransferase family 4 protein [Rhodobacter sp.]|nr:glycosyltransferase family 4 protein [Rhodobacter sp.]